MLTAIMIGNKIAEARKRINLSQAQLAQKLSISAQAVGKWERGESMPDIIMFNRIAEVLNVDLNYFSVTFQTTVSDKSVSEPLITNPSEPLPSDPKKQPGWNMSSGNWVDGDFSGIKNLHEKFNGSNIKNCLFVGSEMAGLLLHGNDVGNCDFTHSNLDGSRFSGSNIVNSIFKDCSLKALEFTGSQIKGCNFSGADLTGAVVKSCAMLKNEVVGTIWSRTTFRNTHLSEIIFEGIMAECAFENCGFSKVKFQGVTFVNTFFKNKGLKKIRFVECNADKITYAFLKNGKADMTGITLIEQGEIYDGK